jgi:hypothetical protein
MMFLICLLSCRIWAFRQKLWGRRVRRRSHRGESFGLGAVPNGSAGPRCHDASGDLQIKLTAGNSVAMYATCDRLVVPRIVPPETAEIVYDGPGQPAWEKAAKEGKNGQRVVRLSRLRALAAP